MRLYFATLQRKDYGKAIRFIADGMHFDWYIKSTFLQRMLAKYFLYAELNEATQVIAAYADKRLIGLLIADMQGEPKPFRTKWKKSFVRVFELIGSRFAQKSMDVYDHANEALFKAYVKDHSIHGKIGLFSVDPDLKGQGIGTRLLEELEKREKGKHIVLYTDDACVYKFYEHRGFEREGEKDIVLELPDRLTPLRCFLYSKTL